jgi:putative nucleotidyltransferase with HDIG domain
MSEIRDVIREQIKKIPRLATLPSVAVELISLVDKEDVPVGRVKELLETDPSLTGKVLQIANSPFYGARWRIHTVDQALALIGLNELSNILFSVSMHSKVFHGTQKNMKLLEKLWHHSVACAYLSRSIATKYYINTSGREYVSGLLHDIGKIVLFEHFPKEMKEIREIIEGEMVADLEAEERVLGITHEDIGLYLGEAWGLPESIKNVIRHHHNPRQDNASPVLTAVVHVADLLCQRWGVSVDEGEPATALINDEGWQILIEEQSYLAGMDPERVAYDLKLDIQSARLFSDGSIQIRDELFGDD